MKHQRLCLMVILTLLLGGGAWLPSTLVTARESLPPAAPSAPDRAPDGLTVVDWGTIQEQVAKLTADDGAAGDRLGESAAIDGDTAVVGAGYADVNGNIDQGAAYVFYRDRGGPDAWGQVIKLTADDGAESDVFGYSVSVSGDTVVVGAVFTDVDGSTDQGAAHVFYRNEGGPNAWGQIAKLTADDGMAFDAFGFGVSVSGDTAVVGARYADVGDNVDQGAAYVFSRNQGGPDAWGQVAKLTADDGMGEDQLGCSVAVNGDVAIAGAIYGDGAAADQGAAYVFYRNQGGVDAWGQVAKLTANDGAAINFFGHSVALDGATAVVGAPNADVGSNSRWGAAYVFIQDHGGPDAWGQAAKLDSADGAYFDYFGVRVSISGDNVVVGAHLADVGGNIDQGAAYVFARNHGGMDAWGQVVKLTADDGAADDWFGVHVPLSGKTVVVAALFADIGDTVDQGAAYVFHLPSMYVQVIIMHPIQPQPGLTYVLGFVRIVDGDLAPVSGATVDVEWTLPSGYTLPQSRTTNAGGWAVPLMRGFWPGTYQLCVTNVTADGYLYDPGENWETCDAITPP